MFTAGWVGWPDDRSPFPGLRAFDVDVHRAFFDRRREVDDLGASNQLAATPVDLGVTRTVLALVLLLAPLTSCGSFQQGFREGYNGPTTAAPAADPDLRPGWHHVVYTWGVSRTLKAGEDQNIGVGWNNPVTGAHEYSSASSAPLRFPYLVQFDVTDLHVDYQHVAADSTVDVANLVVDCTVTLDGQVLAADPGTRAVIDARGQVQTGGGSSCVPHK